MPPNRQGCTAAGSQGPDPSCVNSALRSISHRLQLRDATRWQDTFRSAGLKPARGAAAKALAPTCCKEGGEGAAWSSGNQREPQTCAAVVQHEEKPKTADGRTDIGRKQQR